MRSPLFRDRHGLRAPRRGPLYGRRVLAVVAPTECDARGVRALGRRLRRSGVRLGVTMECHGEARGENGSALYPDCLLIEVAPERWDAVVFAGGRGAARVAEDPLARELARRFAGAGRPIASLGDGARVLDAARLDGIAAADPAALARALTDRLR
ncbi:MAG TPA: DJ-1/PfpI family protein [Polyangia bacterium]|nr:DJ-1/PfpI family protein [Polyangia bacterium]